MGSFFKTYGDEGLLQVAKICHEANRAYCETIGDFTQPSWEEAENWQKESAYQGANMHVIGDYGPEESHESWMRQKVRDGWVYGVEKDTELKTHPCLVPYEDLPYKQKQKDYLFRAICHAFKECYNEEH